MGNLSSKCRILVVSPCQQRVNEIAESVRPLKATIESTRNLEMACLLLSGHQFDLAICDDQTDLEFENSTVNQLGVRLIRLNSRQLVDVWFRYSIHGSYLSLKKVEFGSGLLTFASHYLNIRLSQDDLLASGTAPLFPSFANSHDVFVTSDYSMF